MVLASGRENAGLGLFIFWEKAMGWYFREEFCIFEENVNTHDLVISL